MQLTINLPSRAETIAFVQARWEEATRDPAWSQIEGKFETNSFGQMIVTPPPTFSHNDRAYRIARQLEQHLGGQGRVEVPIATIDGVKVPNAAWFSDERYQQARGQATAQMAPEICIEVISPSNTEAELAHKRNLYFDAGAIECWQCDTDGRMTYYHQDTPDQPETQSKLCPNFPQEIRE